MTQYVAFLRGINVGGHRVTMDRLRAVFEDAGVGDVSTFIASGNVIFATDAEDVAALEAMLEGRLAEALGFEADVFLRRLPALPAVADACARALTARPDWNGHVIFLKSAPDAEANEALGKLETPVDLFPSYEDHVFWLRAGTLTESEVKGPEIAKALGRAPHSMRNLNTVNRIIAKYLAPG